LRLRTRASLIVLRRRLHGRIRLTNHDRWFLIQLYRWVPLILQVLTIIRPETLLRWHRAGFCCYWRWKSRPLGGRPQIDTELRALIRRMRVENPLWDAPRIHGELLKLGFEVAQSSVAKYMDKRRGSLSQEWRTFLRNHAPDIAAMDLSDRSGVNVDHTIVLGKMHLRRILRCYAHYYNEIGTHRSLDKDAPVTRPVQRVGVIISCAVLADFITTTLALSFQYTQDTQFKNLEVHEVVD